MSTQKDRYGNDIDVNSPEIVGSNNIPLPRRRRIKLDSSFTATDDPVGLATNLSAVTSALAAGAAAVAFAAALGSTIPTAGTAIPDADTTISLSTGSHFVMATRTAERIITMGVTGTPVENETMSLDVIGTGAFVVHVKDDAGTLLFDVAASQKMTVIATFDGTHFANARAQRIQ